MSHERNTITITRGLYEAVLHSLRLPISSFPEGGYRGGLLLLWGDWHKTLREVMCHGKGSSRVLSELGPLDHQIATAARRDPFPFIFWPLNSRTIG